MIAINSNMATNEALCINYIYSQTSNISGTLVGNKITDHTDLVEVSPVGVAPATSSFST